MIVGETSESPARSLWQWVVGADEQIPEGWRRPGPTRRGIIVDVLVAFAVTGLMILSRTLQSILFDDRAGVGALPPLAGPWVLWLVPALYLLGLLLRRIAPIPGLLITVAVFVLGQMLGYHEYQVTNVVMFVVFYSAGAWSHHRTVVTVLRLLILKGMLIWAILVLFAEVGAEADLNKLAAGTLYVSLINIGFFLGALILGSNGYWRAGIQEAARRRRAEYREQAEQLRAERAIVAEQAVRLDRIAIARDLHDIVAHHVSLMGLQAAAARRTMEADPERARGSLLSIEDSARTAVEELQSMLMTLRSPDAGDARVNVPSGNATAPSTHSIERLGELIEEYRGAGGCVLFQTFGEPRPVPPAIAITMYRILQEALTNVRKHAGLSARVDVRLRYLPDAVELDVSDDGVRAAPGPSLGGGRGIAGMRERAFAVRGTLEAGPRSGGGFRVRSLLPLAPAAIESSRKGS